MISIEGKIMPRFRRLPPVLTLLLALAPLFLSAAVRGQARPVAELFPQPMVVEHQLIEREADGTVFHGEPVRDTYGGSWIVSERPDGSRLVIDLARREMTEMRPAEGVYWNIGFARFGELRERVARLEGIGQPLSAALRAGGAEAGDGAGGGTATAKLEVAELEVIELGGVAAKSAAAAGAAASGADRDELPASLAAPEVRRFEVRRKGSPQPEAEVWVDGRWRLSEAAGAALQAFEEDALGVPRGAGDGTALEPARVMAAIRRAAGGALPVLTVLPVLRSSGEKVGESENRVISARPLPAFPAELARVPEGLRRASHPLESIVLALEEQARIDAALAGLDLP